MGRWFRFHAEAMRNPKVARLSDAQFRLWVELMAVAAENDGAIPGLDDLKHMLKRRLDHLSRGLKDLIRAGLIDPLGDGYEPHNWSKHQYKSDTSTARVHKHRAKRNVSETPPDTETDTETEEKAYAFSAGAVRLKPKDYRDWRKRFHTIPDFDAELHAMAAWVNAQPPEKQRKWFATGSAWMNKRHQEGLANRQRAGPAVVVGV